MSTRCIPWG